MSRINLPINQVRLTNVAVVRMAKGGKRFEIACYRNKVVNYRQGIETDLSEVLQTERVFSNVSKGEFAKSQDLHSIFGTTDESSIISLILNKGDLQIGDLERTQQYESMARDISTWISEHCIHPVSQRPYTIPQIRQAMKAAEYTIHPTRSMKRQYLDCFKKVQSVLSIIRAPMELQLTYPASVAAEIQGCCQEHALQVVVSTTRKLEQTSSSTVATSAANAAAGSSTDGNSNVVVATLIVDPSMYRVLEDLTKTMDHVRLEILKQVVMREGDSNLEDEVRGTKQLQQDTADAKLLTDQLESVSLRDREDVVTAHHVATAAAGSSDTDDDDDNDDNRDDDGHCLPSATAATAATAPKSRQSQKQAQKKSKKAKRREKEETEDRQARIKAEEIRRAQRADLVGEPKPMHSDVSSSSKLDGEGGTAVSSSDGKACLTCGGSFTQSEYRAHFRSDWHRYNIKLKMKNVAPVSEREFLLCDSDAFFESL